MTGCVVLVSCHGQETAGYDVLVLSRCHKDISNNVIFAYIIVERMTLNDICHKHA